jgi:hypothetical protein
LWGHCLNHLSWDHKTELTPLQGGSVKIDCASFGVIATGSGSHTRAGFRVRVFDILVCPRHSGISDISSRMILLCPSCRRQRVSVSAIVARMDKQLEQVRLIVQCSAKGHTTWAIWEICCLQPYAPFTQNAKVKRYKVQCIARLSACLISAINIRNLIKLGRGYRKTFGII